MNTPLWIITALLALVFLVVGAGKLTSTRAALREKGMTYVDDFSDGQIKAIGAVEILGAIGLIVPAFIGGLEFLVPTAAIGLAIVMIGAVVVHSRREESYTPALVLGALAVFVAVGRVVVGF